MLFATPKENARALCLCIMAVAIEQVHDLLDLFVACTVVHGHNGTGPPLSSSKAKKNGRLRIGHVNVLVNALSQSIAEKALEILKASCAVNASKSLARLAPIVASLSAILDPLLDAQMKYRPFLLVHSRNYLNYLVLGHINNEIGRLLIK